MNNTNNNGLFVPVINYNNAEIDKSKILSDLKGKSGIYQWTHKESGRIYIGSAVDLSIRLGNYFKKSYLDKFKTIYIYNALLHHGYSAFSLSILELIDISNLSKEEARKLILEREQHYLVIIFKEAEPNTYNILKMAGSLLGYQHTEESLAKMSLAASGENHPMFGKTGKNNPNFGRTHLPETLVKMSIAKTGENHPRGMLGKVHSPEVIAKMSVAKVGNNHPNYGKYKKVYVYAIDSNSKSFILHKSFNSSLDTAKFFDCTTRSIYYYLDKNKLYKKQWILSTSLIIKE